MSRIFTTIQINRPVKQVFDFITTPDTWPLWHPRVIGITGNTDHSLNIGEQVTEEFTDAGRHSRVIWTIIEREDAQRWVINGKDLEGRDAGQVAFTFKQISNKRLSNGTRLEREKTDATNDRMIFRLRQQLETFIALQKFKNFLEKNYSTENQWEDSRVDR